MPNIPERTALVASAGPTLVVRAAEIEGLEGSVAGLRARIERPTFLIGSGPTADFCLPDDTVSREHLRVALTPEGVVLRDEASTNGTFIGQLRIRHVLLSTSTVVTLGSAKLSFRIESEATTIPLSASTGFGAAIGVSSGMRHVFSTLERAAPSDTTILIEGESGVGKEILAHAIHEQSTRAQGPFVAIDCGAISPNLIESELFGHERGAFTGADRTRSGAFEEADGGTLFLDELGEMPLDLQPKLLRALEAREVRPVGSSRVKRVNVRVVAATNRNLSDAVAKGRFRADLFYRLAVVRVNVPPLRDRREDILPLATAFLRRSPGYETSELPPDFAAMLASYAWPGNVRELRNVLERYMVLGIGDPGLFGDKAVVTPGGGTLSHLPYHEARRIALDRFDREYFPAVLERAGNVVSRAAELAQVGRGSLHRMLGRMRRAVDSPEPDE